jgi:hypothetical protein
MMYPGSDAVRERAYRIWETEGKPHGRDLEHWLQAEREVSAAEPPAVNQPTKARSTDGKKRRAAGARTRKAAS